MRFSARSAPFSALLTLRSHALTTTGRFAAGRIQRFLLIQLKRKQHHHLDALLLMSLCVCHAELKSYLFTHLQGAKRPGGELTKERNVHKSSQIAISVQLS